MYDFKCTFVFCDQTLSHQYLRKNLYIDLFLRLTYVDIDAIRPQVAVDGLMARSDPSFALLFCKLRFPFFVH